MRVANELDRNFDCKQALDSLNGHRTGKYIATDDDLVYSFAVNLHQNGVERRQISMNIIERCDSHELFTWL